MAEVVLPVLNEREALPWVLGRMPAEFEPIVVDNGSTDGSGALAASLGARVVTEPRPGFGAACYAGLAAARADVVCFMDADASFDPRELPLVAAPVGVLGSGDRLERVLERRLGEVRRLLRRARRREPRLHPPGDGLLRDDEQGGQSSTAAMSRTVRKVPFTVPVTFERPSRGW